MTNNAWDEIYRIVTYNLTTACNGTPDAKETPAVPFLKFLLTHHPTHYIGVRPHPPLDRAIAISDATYINDLECDPIDLAKFRVVYGYD